MQNDFLMNPVDSISEVAQETKSHVEALKNSDTNFYKQADTVNDAWIREATHQELAEEKEKNREERRFRHTKYVELSKFGMVCFTVATVVLTVTPVVAKALSSRNSA